MSGGRAIIPTIGNSEHLRVDAQTGLCIAYWEARLAVGSELVLGWVNGQPNQR